MTKLIDELKSLLEEHDLETRVKNDEYIEALHNTLPVSLIIKLKNKDAVVEINTSDDLRDALEELIESGEDIRSMADDVLSELRDVAVEISRFLKEKNYEVKLMLREGENDVRDLVDEVYEEHKEVLEEEFGFRETEE